MKKLVMLGLLVASSTGCGRGWLPRIFHGAPCLGNCQLAVPNVGCANCPTGPASAGYGDYSQIGGEQIVGENVVDGGYQGPYGGQIIDQGVPLQSAPPSMAPLSAPQSPRT